MQVLPQNRLSTTRTSAIVGARFKQNDRVTRRTTGVSALYDTSVGTVLELIRKQYKNGRTHWSYRVKFDNSDREIVITQSRIRALTPDEMSSDSSSN